VLLPLLICAVCLCWITYVLFGYPLLLRFLARRERPIQKAFEPRTVSIVLAVHNGSRWIRRKIQNLLDLDYPSGLVEIIVVSDGSTDPTADLAREFTDPRIRVIEIPHSGKSAALNRGIAEATGEILFFVDVRQQIDLSSLRNLVADFGDPAVGAASGELFIRAGATTEEANTGLYWKYEKFIRRNLSALDSVPGVTGCIYAMRRDLAVAMPPEILLDDVFLPMNAFLRGYRVILDETAKAWDEPSTLNSEFYRKVRTQAGVVQVVRQLPALLTPRNRMLGHFLSHKIGRLTIPWALLLLAVTTPFLPPQWRFIIAAIQIIGYGLALIGAVAPEGTILKRVASPLTTAVILFGAAMWGMSVLFRDPQSLWKR